MYTVSNTLPHRIHIYYREDRFPSTAIIQKLSKELGLSTAQVSKHLRQARNRQREEKLLVKFTEVAWKLCSHIFLLSYGSYAVLVKEPWMWDADSCWSAYPFQKISSQVYW